MLEPEKRLIDQTAHQIVEGPLHVVGAGAGAAIDAAFHPEASAVSIITEPAGAMAKATLQETEKLATRTFCYAAAVPFRATYNIARLVAMGVIRPKGQKISGRGMER